MPYANACIGLPGPEEGLGAGLDSCVLPTRHEGISIVQTTDLYPFKAYVHTASTSSMLLLLAISLQEIS